MDKILSPKDAGIWRFQMRELIPIEVLEALPDVQRFQNSIDIMWDSHEALREQLAAETRRAEEISACLTQTALALAELQADRRALAEALIWCSGSADFAPGGTARIGWMKGPQAALARPGVQQVMKEQDADLSLNR